MHGTVRQHIHGTVRQHMHGTVRCTPCYCFYAHIKKQLQPQRRETVWFTALQYNLYEGELIKCSFST
jgi:hypothetical protein